MRETETDREFVGEPEPVFEDVVVEVAVVDCVADLEERMDPEFVGVDVEDRDEDTLCVVVFVLEADPVGVVELEIVRVPNSDLDGVPEKVGYEVAELDREPPEVADVETDAVDDAELLPDVVVVFVGQRVDEAELLPVGDFVAVLLPEIDGGAVRVLELVVD